MSAASDFVAAARAGGAVLATAESCTGGQIACAITEVAGASAVFERGFVTYADAAKVEMLGVRQTTLAAHGAVSEPVAVEMAAGAIVRSAANMAVAVTGVAGPGGSGAKPEGRVVFALARPNAVSRVETVEFGPLGRAEVRRASTRHTLDMLIAALRS